MIPKIIHYCWFGGNPLSELAQKCISSWKKYFPEYEIKEWNESNFNLQCCDYVKEAYEAKKWAFVSDYARFWILYYEGGLYFDTDVEVIKPIDDIINNGAFMGCERTGNYGLGVNPGLGIGADPGISLYKEILDDYEKSHFINADGSSSYMTIVTRTTEILNKHGFSNLNQLQQVMGITIYPIDYFCPLDYTTQKLSITGNTRSIHWYDASWFDHRMKKRQSRSQAIVKLFGEKNGLFIGKFYMSMSYYWEWISTGQFQLIKEKIRHKFHIG